MGSHSLVHFLRGEILYSRSSNIFPGQFHVYDLGALWFLQDIIESSTKFSTFSGEVFFGLSSTWRRKWTHVKYGNTLNGESGLREREYEDKALASFVIQTLGAVGLADLLVPPAGGLWTAHSAWLRSRCVVFQLSQLPRKVVCE